MNILGLTVLIVGAIIAVATAWCIVGYVILSAMELIEKFMERYFPAKYYYDWDEEV